MNKTEFFKNYGVATHTVTMPDGNKVEVKELTAAEISKLSEENKDRDGAHSDAAFIVASCPALKSCKVEEVATKLSVANSRCLIDGIMKINGLGGDAVGEAEKNS